MRWGRGARIVGLLGLLTLCADVPARAADLSPVRVAWGAPDAPRLRRNATLRLLVRWRAEPSARAAYAGTALELIVSLPPGFMFIDGPFQPVPPSMAPENDQWTGPWTTYRWTGQVTADAVDRDTVVTVPLVVQATAPGENWVLTARLRAAHQGREWLEHAALFATVTSTTGEFHEVPKASPPSGAHAQTP